MQRLARLQPQPRGNLGPADAVFQQRQREHLAQEVLGGVRAIRIRDGREGHRQARTTESIGLLVGSPATVAREIDRLAEIPGTAGMMLTFDDFELAVERFGSEVMPLLQCRQAVAAD